MNSLARYLGLAFLLLLFFLGAVLSSRAWLRHETRRIQAEASTSLQVRLAETTRLIARTPSEWNSEDFETIGKLLGARVELSPGTPARSSDSLVIDYQVSPERTPAGTAPLTLRATAPLPSASKLLLAHERIVASLRTLALVLLAVIFVASLAWFLRRDTRESDNSSLGSASRDMRSLEQLAKSSVEREYLLESERAVRTRTEQDLEFNQQLLSKALDEKIQLGRDLHDGIIQSLYSAGLTLEAARSRIAAAPEEASQRISQTIDLLNATIREVRGYINALKPEALQRSGFKQALSTLADELRAQRDVSFDLRIDDQAASTLSLDQARAILQITREAISNSLRHGEATAIAIYLGLADETIVLVIRDNGKGFDASYRRPEGHGLPNMEARIAQLSGKWALSSKPGEGTVIRLDLPAPLQEST
ncbi:MAG: sensor histidine kinase [Opitutaceae bacterium]|jgi:signal transduction histidine kinase